MNSGVTAGDADREEGRGHQDGERTLADVACWSLRVMFDATNDARVRTAAFRWLEEAVRIHGDVLPRDLLARGLDFEGKRVPLVGPKGIFKPRQMDLPLSITTVPKGPYNDSFGPDNLIRYRYRGTDPSHPDNLGLRACMARGLPLVYFFGVSPARYVSIWPVFIVGDDPRELTFTVAVDDVKIASSRRVELVIGAGDDATVARREYIATSVRVRLHQRTFRERVLQAYHRQCAVCRLRYEELLDAAHIIPDVEPRGEPRVENGLALCALHHAAFDRFFLGVRPDYVVEVRPDILRAGDGPTLVHAIQRLHGVRIILPAARSDWPDPELLEIRYNRFRQAG